MEGYDEYPLVKTYESGRRYRETVSLKRQYGVVRIIKFFGWVVIDDTDEIKIPPGDIPLPVGTHTIRTKGKTEGISVYVPKDETVRVTLP